MIQDSLHGIIEGFKLNFQPVLMVFIVLPIFIIMPAAGYHDFPVFRFQHYELHGHVTGSTTSSITADAVVIGSKIHRKCVLIRLVDLTLESLKDIISSVPLGLIIIIPSNTSSMTNEQLNEWQLVDEFMVEMEMTFPIYFVHESSELNQIYAHLQSSVSSVETSALELLIKSIFDNGYQIGVSTSYPKQLSEFVLTNIEGSLTGYGLEDQLPTIVFVAHYDALGVAPSLSFGTDSNASGVVALLHLAKIFSKLYSTPRSAAKHNLLFLLSAAGKFNYQGSKRFLEENMDVHDDTILKNAAFVICLDSIGNKGLHLHVSKPPAEDSPLHSFLKKLEYFAKELNVAFSMVHKKINLAQEQLAWEHERYSFRKVPASTLSSYDNVAASQRRSLFDQQNRFDVNHLTTNIQIISKSMMSLLYNIEPSLIAESELEMENWGRTQVKSLHSYISEHPRSAQMLRHDGQVVLSLVNLMQNTLKNVNKHTFKLERKDPEVIFYDTFSVTAYAYRVKPAVFDLFLAMIVGSYIFGVYLFISYFPNLYYTLHLNLLRNKPKFA